MPRERCKKGRKIWKIAKIAVNLQRNSNFNRLLLYILIKKLSGYETLLIHFAISVFHFGSPAMHRSYRIRKGYSRRAAFHLQKP